MTETTQAQVDTASIERAYSAGLNDWPAIENEIKTAYAYDRMNAVTFDADICMILIACRNALDAATARADAAERVVRIARPLLALSDYKRHLTDEQVARVQQLTRDYYAALVDYDATTQPAPAGAREEGDAS